MITSGENRVSSHTSGGALNWMKDVNGKAIMDMACSHDCTTIVLGSQDGKVWFESTWRGFVDISGRVVDKRVEISRDGSVFSAGALNGKLYIMDHNAKLLATPGFKVSSSNGHLR